MAAPLAFDAATVIIARDSVPPGNGVQVLLIARHPQSRSAAGAYVFPGGRIEPEDAAPGVEAICAGLSRREAASTLSERELPDRALGFWVGAIREVFEEVSLLFAYGQDGHLVRLVGGGRERLWKLREACKQKTRSFHELIQTQGFRLATDRLHYFAHWITPEERALRFATQFFVAGVPPDQEVVLDTSESTDFRWLSPEEALAEHRRGNLPLHFPTIRSLEALCGFSSVEALVAATKERQIRPIMPRVVVEDGKERILLPDDPGYF